MKRDTLIETISKAIEEELFELDDNYDYDCDCEFGGFEASCRTGCFEFEFGTGKCEIEATVTWPYHKAPSIEVLIYGYEGKVENAFKDLSNIEKAVQDYMDKHLDFQALLDAMTEDLSKANEDEWQSHGFRDAADYYHWRYC